MRVITDLAEFARLQDWPVSPHPFLAHPWLRLWWQYFGAGNQLSVADLTGSREPERSYAPLYIQRHGPFRVAYIVGTGPVPTRGMGLADRADLFAGPPEPEALVAILASERWEMLWLRALPNDSSGAAGFAQAAALLGWRAQMRPRSQSLYVELPASWEAYLASRPASVRRSYRFRRHKLEKAGRVEVAHLTGPQANLDALLDEIYAVEAASWKAAAGTGPLTRLRLRSFVNDLIRALLPVEKMAVATLRLDGELLAYSLNFLSDCVVGYNTAYRQSAHAFSPGTVLAAESFRWAIEKGYRIFDMARGTEAYKEWWATGRRDEVDLIVTRPTARSFMAAALLVEARARLKENPLAERVRDWVVRKRAGGL